jgi:hypothetical protein
MAFTNVQNRNFQAPSKFNFVVDRLKDFDFYVQSINIPDVVMTPIQRGTPFSTLKYPADKIVFSNLIISFKISEGMYNWYEIFSWLQSLGFPENQKQYGDLRTGNLKDLNGKVQEKRITREIGDIYGQGTLTIHTSHNNPYLIINFINLYPIALTNISLDTTQSDSEYLTAAATFAYDYFTVEKLK